MKPKTLLPIGFEDLTVLRAKKAHEMLVSIVNTFQGFDYALVDPPILEYEESLLNAPDGLQAHEIFRLIDPISHQTLGARGDITVQIIRLAQDHLANAPRPLRLSYYGQVLRINNTPLRPQRQYMQLGLEQIGGNENAEIEVLQVALEALRNLGISGICLDFVLPTVLRRYLNQLPEDVQEMLNVRDIGNVRQAIKEQKIDHKIGTVLEFLLLLPPDPLSALDALEQHEDFTEDLSLFNQLRHMIAQIQQSHPQIDLSLDMIEQNGFAYKTGIAYTVLAKGQNTSLGRGGCYNAGDENACGVSLNLHNLLGNNDQKPPVKKLYIPHNTEFSQIRQWRDDGWVVTFHTHPEQITEKAQQNLSLTKDTHYYVKNGQIQTISFKKDAS